LVALVRHLYLHARLLSGLGIMSTLSIGGGGSTGGGKRIPANGMVALLLLSSLFAAGNGNKPTGTGERSEL
jgi:hypothetical protein